MFLELFQITLAGKVYTCILLHASLCTIYGNLCRFRITELATFFAIPVLRDILPTPFLTHLDLLVASVYIFSSQLISEEDFQLARCLLQQFYEEFSDLYGMYYVF